METKVCARCLQSKPLTDFYRESSRRDKLNYKCKECVKAKYLERRKKSGLPMRTSPKFNMQEYQRIRQVEYRAKYKNRVNANQYVQRAVNAGRLPHIETQTCAQCEAQAREYHHPDYNKPLDVVPLCKSCHRRWHRDNKVKGS